MENTKTVYPLEASLLLNRSDLGKIKDISKKNPIESCGVCCSDGVFELKNIAKNPCCFFIVDPDEYLYLIKNKNILYFWHSHVFGNERPSEYDILTSQEAQLNSLIYSCVTDSFSFFSYKSVKLVYFSV